MPPPTPASFRQTLPAALVALSALLLHGRASAQEASATTAEGGAHGPGYNVHLDVPLVDARMNLQLAAWPSMQQSLLLGKDFYDLTHTGLLASMRLLSPSKGWVQSFGEIAVLALFDVYALSVPPFEGWMHEEWHRAVMSRRDIDSHNGIYDLEFADFTAVSKVRDEDLIRLKRDYPAEQVRLSSAGLEGDVALARQFDYDRFFHGTHTRSVVTQWVSLFGVFSYLQRAGYGSDSVTEEENADSGADVPARDFTGLDPNGWVYDLFRPDEPYEARGVHPSGVGIDRYRSESDLTGAERRFLRRQVYLSLLNFANPNLFGFYAFDLGEGPRGPVRFNATLQHTLTPSGYSLGTNLYLSHGSQRWFGQAQAFVSDDLVLPGLSLQLVRHPATPWLSLTPGVSLWLQPEEQRFLTRSVSPGAALSLRASVNVLAPLELYAEGSAKTAGWLQGDVFLGPSLGLIVGAEALVF